MNNRYVSSFVKSALSIGPIVILILILSFLFPLFNSSGNIQLFTGNDYLLLIIGAIVLITGLALFQIGASSSLSKVGNYMGGSLSQQPKLFIVILFAFALGTLITCAEPSILIVADQVNIHPIVFIISIAVGVGIFVVIGILRIIFHGSLKVWYLLFYFLTFLLICLICINPDIDKRAFLPFIFDAGGVTTGSATVPFILSLGAGVATVRGGRKSTQDSFGLVGMASIGPIMTMTLLILLSNNAPDIPQYAELGENVFLTISRHLIPGNGSLGSMIEVLIAISPILLIFFIYQSIYIKLPKGEILRLSIGFVYTFVGLSLFLAAAGAAMTPIGYVAGKNIAVFSEPIVIFIGFIVGMVAILCEPAVHVLTGQIENISDGRITKMTVLLTLSIGVGIAIALSTIRVLFEINILYIVIPGYAISLILMFGTPDIYTAMAFDSGGTASGPMSTSFVLPMIVGLTTAINTGLTGGELGTKVYENGFGVVALIALTPIIAVQVLGIVGNIKVAYRRYISRKHLLEKDDAQIIHF